MKGDFDRRPSLPDFCPLAARRYLERLYLRQVKWVPFRHSPTHSGPQFCHYWNENGGNEAKAEEGKRQFGLACDRTIVTPNYDGGVRRRRCCQRVGL